MIEDIKKEIEELQKYKKMWEELKQSCYCKNATYEEEITYDEAFGDILEELEQKYNLDKEVK